MKKLGFFLIEVAEADGRVRGGLAATQPVRAGQGGSGGGSRGAVGVGGTCRPHKAACGFKLHWTIVFVLAQKKEELLSN